MSVLTIYPYLIGNVWVFDDSRTSLKEEAFVCGMSEIISRVVELKEIPNAAQGFALRFSDRPFRGFDVELKWCDSEKSQAIPVISGNWYKGVIAGEEMTGWLCPALGLYFHETPARLYAGAEPLPDGVNAIWDISRDDARAKRFVSAQA